VPTVTYKHLDLRFRSWLATAIGLTSSVFGYYYSKVCVFIYLTVDSPELWRNLPGFSRVPLSVGWLSLLVPFSFLFIAESVIRSNRVELKTKILLVQGISYSQQLLAWIWFAYTIFVWRLPELRTHEPLR
jgi:hypothetical protein